MGRRAVEASEGRPDFGLWLKSARRQAGLTQQELAERMGFSKQYVSNLEVGYSANRNGVPTAPDKKMVLSLCKALELSSQETDAALLRFGYTPEMSFPLILADASESRIMGIPGQSAVTETILKLRADAERLKEAASLMERAACELEQSLTGV